MHSIAFWLLAPPRLATSLCSGMPADWMVWLVSRMTPFSEPPSLDLPPHIRDPPTLRSGAKSCDLPTLSSASSLPPFLHCCCSKVDGWITRSRFPGTACLCMRVRWVSANRTITKAFTSATLAPFNTDKHRSVHSMLREVV